MIAVIIIVCVFVGGYLIFGGIGSYLLYDLYTECAKAIETLAPDVYKYTSLRFFWEKPKWARIKECLSIGYSPIHCLPSLRALVFSRADLQNEFVSVQMEVAKMIKQECETSF